MPATYEPIATTTLSTSSVVFSGIPNTYTDLKVIFVGFASSGTGRVRFNDDSGSNYSSTIIRGNGTSASSQSNTNSSQIWFNGGDGPSNTAPQFVILDIMSYAGSLIKNVLLSGNNDKNGSGETLRTIGVWNNTSAITSITIDNNNGVNWSGQATLYGIARA